MLLYLRVINEEPVVITNEIPDAWRKKKGEEC